MGTLPSVAGIYQLETHLPFPALPKCCPSNKKTCPASRRLNLWVIPHLESGGGAMRLCGCVYGENSIEMPPCMHVLTPKGKCKQGGVTTDCIPLIAKGIFAELENIIMLHTEPFSGNCHRCSLLPMGRFPLIGLHLRYLILH